MRTRSLVFYSHCRRYRRGFTLTELAIVMGVVGLILGAIWVAASQVSSSNKIQSAEQQTAFIVSNYKTVYASKGIDFAGTVDITCNGVNDNFFPPNTLRGVACTTGQYTTTYPLNPWGGYIRVDGDNGTQGILVSMVNIPQDACIRYASSFPNSGDIISIKINTSAPITALPVSPVTASGIGGCVAGSTNTVAVNYKAR